MAVFSAYSPCQKIEKTPVFQALQTEKLAFFPMGRPVPASGQLFPRDYLNIFNFPKINVTSTLSTTAMTTMIKKPRGLFAKGIPATFTFMP